LWYFQSKSLETKVLAMKKTVSLSVQILFLCLVSFAGCSPENAEDSAGSLPLWYDAEKKPETETHSEKPEQKVSAPAKGQMVSVSLPDSNRNNTGSEPQQFSEKAVSKYGIGVSLDGFRPFPANDPWNQDISKAPVDPNSDRILAYLGFDGHLHPDFGSGTWNGSPIGIPYILVSGDQARMRVQYTAYGGQSDPGPFPIPFETPVEGAPGTDGDRHALIIDRDHWVLYELYRAFPKKAGVVWEAESGAIFNLKTNTKRPRGWTSADAAGLPIFPGLVRYDEVGEQKKIAHALRFTLEKTRRAYVSPASHWASQADHPLLPPMGMRIRLKADVELSEFPAEVQVILQALKTYGMILADNGSNWFISGTPDERWDNDALRALRKIKVHQLEILQMENIVTPYSL